MGLKESPIAFEDESFVDLDERRIRAPFRFWMDDTWQRTVRYSKEYPWLYSVAVWAPVLVLVVLFKLIKFELLAPTPGPPIARTVVFTMGEILLAHGLLPVLVLIASLMIGLLVQSRFAARGYFLLPATIVSFLLLVAVIGGVLNTSPAGFSADFLVAAQRDLRLAGVAISATALVLTFVRGIARRLFLVSVQGFAIVVSWVCCFDFGYFIQTGSIADSYMMQFSILHLPGLSSLIGSELDVASMTLLAIPLLLSLLPMTIANSRNSRSHVHVHSYAWRMKRGIVMTVIIVAVSFWADRVELPSEVSILRSSVPVGLFSNQYSFQNDVALDATNGLEISWPDESFALAETDSTRYANIVFIVLESTRGAYSNNTNGLSVLPFLDSLQTQSVVVADMSVVVPHTNKALVPLLCGVYPELAQTESKSVTNSCLAYQLGRLGYETAFFTTADLDFENKGDLLDAMGYATVIRPTPEEPNDFSFVNYFGVEDNALLEPALAWVDKRATAGTPFLATFLTITAHHDYDVPTGWTRRSYTQSGNFNSYLNTVAYQDAFVEQLFVSFAERGLLDNTLFVIVGDHGEAFSEHGLQGHSAVLYQEVANTFAMIHGPEFMMSRIVAGPRQQIDIVPTVAEILRVDYPRDQLPGRSLFSDPDSTRELYMAGWVENSSVGYRVGSYKYIYNFRRTPTRLFDLENDPDELRDLAGSISDDSLATIERRVLTWRQRVNSRYKNR